MTRDLDTQPTYQSMRAPYKVRRARRSNTEHRHERTVKYPVPPKFEVNFGKV